ncbi:hypothetical protein BDZ89DRAFT_1068857 [Hymenopellis radicata]|nr:hypothetical protein BDZ89DRAFT_1068857 [Hymenopellis radicata]
MSTSAPLDLVNHMEVWEADKECFAFWSIVWTNGNDYFYHRYPHRDLPEDICVLTRHAQIIPKTYYRVPPPPGLTPASVPPPDDSYVKAYKPIYVGDPEKLVNTSQLADDMIREARICQRLADSPHPNICEYRGFVEQDGLMTGLCFKRYGKDLHTAVTDGDEIDVDGVIQGIKRGLDHLHSLKLVHCDINPFNVVLGPDSQAVIIDFDSCYEEGTEIVGKGGRKIRNDLYGMQKIEEWLKSTLAAPTDT